MPILPVRRGLTRIIASLLLGLAGTAAVQAQGDPDDTAWSQARQANTVDAYQDYLSQYPLGAHSQDAFALIIRLSQPEDIEQAINPAAGEEDPSTQEAATRREPDPPDPY
jgi:hypothetical protein